MALLITPYNGGGQSCHGSSPTAGGAVDTLNPFFSPTAPNGPQAISGDTYVLSQEVAHCYGQVNPTSPNSDPNNTPHSLHKYVPLNPGETLVDFIDHQDYPQPKSVMFPFFDNNDPSATAFEGHEYNSLYRALLARGVNPGPPVQSFQIFGLFRRVPKKVTIIQSEKGLGDPAQLTRNVQGGRFAVVFYNQRRRVVSQLRFGESFTSTHPGPVGGVVPLSLEVRLPRTARSAAVIDYGGARLLAEREGEGPHPHRHGPRPQTLATIPFPQRPVRITRVSVRNHRGELSLRWTVRRAGPGFATRFSTRFPGGRPSCSPTV